MTLLEWSSPALTPDLISGLASPWAIAMDMTVGEGPWNELHTPD